MIVLFSPFKKIRSYVALLDVIGLNKMTVFYKQNVK